MGFGLHFEGFGKGPEESYDIQCERLTEKGWTPVTEPVQEVKVNILQWAKVDEELGSLYQRGEHGQRTLWAQPNKTELTTFLVPYVFVPKTVWSPTFLQRAIPGQLIGVSEYR